jgi:hypothetical protein
MSELKKHGTALVRRAADRVADGIMTGHDWSNNDSELARLQAASLLRECADAVDTLRGEAKVMRDLLREAAGVLETIDSDDADENDELTALLAAIGGALQGATA